MYALKEVRTITEHVWAFLKVWIFAWSHSLFPLKLPASCTYEYVMQSDKCGTAPLSLPHKCAAKSDAKRSRSSVNVVRIAFQCFQRLFLDCSSTSLQETRPRTDRPVCLCVRLRHAARRVARRRYACMGARRKSTSSSSAAAAGGAVRVASSSSNERGAVRPRPLPAALQSADASRKQRWVRKALNQWWRRRSRASR